MSLIWSNAEGAEGRNQLRGCKSSRDKLPSRDGPESKQSLAPNTYKQSHLWEFPPTLKSNRPFYDCIEEHMLLAGTKFGEDWKQMGLRSYTLVLLVAYSQKKASICQIERTVKACISCLALSFAIHPMSFRQHTTKTSFESTQKCLQDGEDGLNVSIWIWIPQNLWRGKIGVMIYTMISFASTHLAIPKFQRGIYCRLRGRQPQPNPPRPQPQQLLHPRCQNPRSAISAYFFLYWSANTLKGLVKYKWIP